MSPTLCAFVVLFFLFASDANDSPLTKQTIKRVQHSFFATFSQRFLTSPSISKKGFKFQEYSMIALIKLKIPDVFNQHTGNPDILRKRF
jgi:hypothetical protein